MAAFFSRLHGVATLGALSVAILLAMGDPRPATAISPADEARSSPSLFGSYLSGRVARGERDTSAAAQYFSQALEKDPGSDILLESAYMLEAIDGNWPRAVALAEQLVRHDESHRIARYVLGAKAIRDGDHAAADTHFSMAKKGPISDLTTGLARAWIDLGRDRTNEAFAALDAMKDSDWSQVYQRFHRALLADVAGRTEASDQAFAASFKKNERTLRIAEAYVRHLASRGEFKRARDVIRQNAGDGELHPIVRALSEQVDKGEKLDTLVRNAQEGVAEVLFGIGDVLTSEGGIELGTIYLQLALYLRPDFPLARATLGEVYESNRRYESALAAYDGVPRDSPLWLGVKIRKAFSLNALERVDEARALLDELAKDFPSETRPLDALGNILRSRERYEEAQAAYARAIALVKTPQKEHWSLFYSRGVCFERMKQWPKAEADLKMALKLNPEQPLVLNYLGYSWVDQGRNLKQAMQHIRKAVKLKPDDGYFVDSLGWAYFRLGNFEAATEHLERAVELRPEDPVINDHLGDAYWHVGRKLEARYQWEQALTLKPEPEEVEKIKKKLADGLDGTGERKQINASVRTKKTEN